MKRLFLLSAIALVAICSSSCGSSLIDTPPKPEAPERQGWGKHSPLYGDVESVVETMYKLEEKFGEVVRGDILGCYKYYFNDAGDVIEDARYNSYGSLSSKSIYKYDSSGNMIESAWYDSDGSLFYKYIYKYDSSGNMIEEASYESDGSLGGKAIYKYDSSGNKIEGAWYRSDGLLFHKYIYKYDSSGNRIEEAWYDSDGSLFWKFIYKYDSSGNRIEAIGCGGEALIPESLTVYEITYRN